MPEVKLVPDAKALLSANGESIIQVVESDPEDDEDGTKASKAAVRYIISFGDCGSDCTGTRLS